MTGKRFRVNELVKYNYSEISEYIDENHTDRPLRNDILVELLNELHEDNQLLHKMNAEAIDFMYDNFDLNIVFTDRELNDICNEMGWELSEKGIKINQLEKENELLKGQINELQGKASSWKITASEEIINNIKLVRENVKLKSEINMLKNTISRNEAFIERITSKGEWNTTSMKQGDVE